MNGRERLPGREGVLGGAIGAFRWLHGWTQGDLAREARLSASSVSNYERGDVAIPPEALEKIACAFRITLPALLRLAAALLTGAEAIEPLAVPAERADLAATITAELTEDFRARAYPIILALLSSLAADGSQGSPASPEEARRTARAVWACLDRLGSARLPSLAAALPEIVTAALCERLCEESAQVASDDADRALELAELALWVAERVPAADSPLTCQGYASGFVANARRVKSWLRAAREAFARSARLWHEGAPSDPGFLDGARLLDLEASLHIGQRHLPEARRLLAEAAAQARTDLSLGRILIKDAYALELAGDYDGAVTTLGRAASLIPETETRLRCVLQFNLMTNLAHLGRAAEAEPMLPDLHRLSEQSGHKDKGLAQLRLRWLEGKIAAGVGRTAEAIATLSGVRSEFAAKPIRYDEALVSMELAGLYLEQGRTAEVKRLVLQMAPVFEAEDVHTEAQKALKLFSRAMEVETASVALVRRLVAYLYRAQGDPRVQFEEAA